VTPVVSIRFRLARLTGRFVTRTAALLTGGRMPPFVSASVVVVVRERVLVVHDPIRAEAVLPGGHLRWKELPTVGAMRETLEETGYSVECRALVGVYAGKQGAGELGIVRVVYAGEVVAGSLQSSAEGKAEWLPLQTYAASAARDAPIVRDWMAQATAGRRFD
jgi:ADP-ribose pyrophosphatase YjhB (NUDIX family)